MVQKEQLADELGRMRERFEEHVRASHTKTQQEREAARQESQFLIDDLNKKVLTSLTLYYFLVFVLYHAWAEVLLLRSLFFVCCLLFVCL